MEYEKTLILCVDDEGNVLRSLDIGYNDWKLRFDAGPLFSGY